MNQIGRQCRQPIILAFCPAVFDHHIAAFDVTGFAQPFEKGRQGPRVSLRRLGVDKSDHRHRLLLRARCERPRGCRAAEKGDDLAPLHSITSSARPSSVSGKVMPSALAVLRLMYSSTLVASWTGRSAGFSPLRTRPV